MINTRRTLPLPSMSYFCPASCNRRFKSPANLHAHLARAPRCMWFMEETLDALDEDPTDSLEQEDIPSAPVDPWAEYDPLDDPDLDFSYLEEALDEFHFIPEIQPIGAQGPGPQTAANRAKAARFVLDDLDDKRVTDIDLLAGRIVRKAQPSSQQADKDGDIQMSDPSNAPDPRFLPFTSELDWRIAQWAVRDGPGNNAFDRLLAIPGVVDKLGLSYRNIRALHKKLDSMPDKAGEWQTKHLRFKDRPDETFTICHRDPVEAIKSLWKDPELSPEMIFQPCKTYTDDTREDRIFSEMWTGRWWNAVQSKLPEGGTLAPVIVSTDKTQLTQFTGGKSAYPVYLTIGNIPKATRRKPSKHACVLIAYLSVDKLDRTRLSEQDHRSKVQRIFHESMRIVLEPLINAGQTGVLMDSSNGDTRRVFPILSCYVADYPEQCLVTCSKYGTCCKCKAKATELQDPEPAEARTPAWTKSVMEEAKSQAGGNPRAFHTHCMASDVAGGVFRPFWDGFPLCNINRAITPDVLHQLYQGVFKHLVSWCQLILPKGELDRRIRCLPPSFGVRHFKNGISALSQISGSERKNMAKILLACLVGSIPSAATKAITALLDFIYIAQYPTHNNSTLEYLQNAIEEFHEHRDYFIQLGLRKDFNIPKFHSLLHYIDAIKDFGTTDNYNTEMFERLHIDFAKHGWQATNLRDEFPQMIRWLARQEKVAGFESLLKSAGTPIAPVKPRNQRPKTIAKYPNFPGRSLSDVQQKHHAPSFDHHLRIYLNAKSPDRLSARNLTDTALPFSKVNVYNMFHFAPSSLHDDDDEKDVIKAIGSSSNMPNGRFDTVVVIVSETAHATGIKGTRVGRLRVIFTLPQKFDTRLGPRELPSYWPTEPLAYVEWYSPQAANASAANGMMYRIKKLEPDTAGHIPGAVVPLSHIRQSYNVLDKSLFLIHDFGDTVGGRISDLPRASSESSEDFVSTADL
ncbi:hypothetical protein NLJ89_g8041 [Agrocybe chaxingu]|uniref:C2H2-type domain-containing protein n=1 Tax=Agrocybe chaxingu TaxID=84603 RepID=A0A9W8JVH5_9AGAR|nr:hypothetical protein NLJ89_g8041 [Agrocybe chaxingu]